MLQSETADDLAWGRYASPVFENEKESQPQMRSALSRVVFSDLTHALPVHALLQRARQLRETHRRLLVVVGRSKRFVQDGIRGEVKQLVEEYKCGAGHDVVRSTIGHVGTAFVVAAGAQLGGVVVVQAVGQSGETEV